MNKFLLVIFLSTFSFKLAAYSLPNSKTEYCKRHEINDFFQSSVHNVENLIAFKNDGGLFNGGVCWWHSRFQRNLMYLAIFNPNLPKIKNIRQLIKEIRLGKNIVVIPGFKSVSEFTNAYRKEIIQELEEWQLYDGIIHSAWIQGLKGNHSTNPQIIYKTLVELDKKLNTRNTIAYQKLQIKGITAHSWLVFKIKKMDNIFSLGIIDSNSPNQLVEYKYEIGQKNFTSKAYGNFVPYTEFKNEEERLSIIAKNFCSSNYINKQFDEEDYLYGEYEDLKHHDHIYDSY